MKPVFCCQMTAFSHFAKKVRDVKSACQYD